MPLYGAVEIGGTKVDVAFGTSIHDLSDPVRIKTSSPGQTLAEIAEVLRTEEVDRIGVACFGPLDLTTGSLRSTPKPGWSDVSVQTRIGDATGVPTRIDLDVNGSALGEGTWGAAQKDSRFVYVTVGTGIGAGVVVDRIPLRGTTHPEAGHVNVSRYPNDDHPGSCPFHGDCLEGMAAGPALAARFGSHEDWGEDVVDLATHYLAQGMRALIYTTAPERIVVGGGVSHLSGFHDRLREKTAMQLSDYPEPRDVEQFIVPPGLGDSSGLAGALLLAREAAF